MCCNCSTAAALVATACCTPCQHCLCLQWRRHNLQPDQTLSPLLLAQLPWPLWPARTCPPLPCRAAPVRSPLPGCPRPAAATAALPGNNCQPPLTCGPSVCHAQLQLPCRAAAATAAASHHPVGRCRRCCRSHCTLTAHSGLMSALLSSHRRVTAPPAGE